MKGSLALANNVVARPSAQRPLSPVARPSPQRPRTEEQSDPKEKQKELRRKLREELKAQQFTNDQTQKLIKKYDQMPDKFYEGINEIGPVCFGSRQMMDGHGFTPSVPTDLWEWMAGSATLSATARRREMILLPPIDHRLGFPHGHKADTRKTTLRVARLRHEPLVRLSDLHPVGWPRSELGPTQSS